MDMPDAKTVPEGKKSIRTPVLPELVSPLIGAENILRAVTAEDIPADPEQIFLTSWGEWWPKSVYETSLDTQLQDKWCPSQEAIEKSEPVFQE